MNLSATFIARPVATALLIHRRGVGRYRGVSACCRYRPLPQVDFPTISVDAASLPGASSETMAATVATPLERSLGRIAGITEMHLASARSVRHDDHAAVRSVARHRRRRARRAGRHQCVRAACCRRACRATRRTARSIRPMHRS
ncbi:efflux RND transporter permease subunit [Cupriavidus basilensis]